MDNGCNVQTVDSCFLVQAAVSEHNVQTVHTDCNVQTVGTDNNVHCFIAQIVDNGCDGQAVDRITMLKLLTMIVPERSLIKPLFS